MSASEDYKKDLLNTFYLVLKDKPDEWRYVQNPINNKEELAHKSVPQGQPKHGEAVTGVRVSWNWLWITLNIDAKKVSYFSPFKIIGLKIHLKKWEKSLLRKEHREKMLMLTKRANSYYWPEEKKKEQ